MAERYANHAITDLDLLASRLTSPLPSETAKFRAIYRWVCNNITYDHAMYSRNKEMRSQLTGEALGDWNKNLRVKMFQQLARRRRTVCTGYAWLVKELAIRAGLTCVVVDGYGRNISVNIGGEGVPNHTWNAVRLEGQWHLCDPTWSAGVYDMSQGKFIQKFNDAYFLPDPRLFILTHYPLDPRWSIVSEIPPLRQFLDGPLLYSGALHYNVDPVRPETYQRTLSRGDTLVILFGMKAMPADRIILFLNHTITSNAAMIEPRESEAQQCKLTKRFPSRGNYKLDVMVNAEWVLSYNVIVK